LHTTQKDGSKPSFSHFNSTVFTGVSINILLHLCIGKLLLDIDNPNISNMDKIKGVKIILVDDNIPFRTALRRLLQTQFGCEIIAEASDGEEFLMLSNLGSADIVIMDLMMPKKDGLKATHEINWTYPFLKIIAVTMHCDKVYLKELIEKGFKGCIFKNNLYDKIYEAIDTVMNDHLYFPIEIKP